MREENITLAILDWLKARGWHINSFDYPQSGTGSPLRSRVQMPNNKNKGTIIPDIIATRGDLVVFFENKVDFYGGDLDALNLLKFSGDYDDAISQLLMCDPSSKQCHFGVGLADKASNVRKLLASSSRLDFGLLVSESKDVRSLLHSYEF